MPEYSHVNYLITKLSSVIDAMGRHCTTLPRAGHLLRYHSLFPSLLYHSGLYGQQTRMKLLY